MQNWPTTLLALNKGIDADAATNAAKLSVTNASNVDFTQIGSIRPRLAWRDIENFTLTGNTTEDIPVSTFVGNRPATRLDTPYGIFTARDATGEFPAIILKGRVFAWDDKSGMWFDRKGATPKCNIRLQEASSGILPFNPSVASPALSPGLSFTGLPAESYDFGFTGESPSGIILRMWGDGGAQQGQVETSNPAGCGSGALCAGSQQSLLAYVPAGTHNLILTTRVSNTDNIVEYVLKTDARIPTGNGDQPIICCDYDSAFCYITYFTSAAGANLVLLRVNVLTGAITHLRAVYSNATDTPLCSWVSNSYGSIDRVVAVVGTSTTTFLLPYVSSTMTAVAAAQYNSGVSSRYVVVGNVGNTVTGFCTFGYTDSLANLYINSQSLTSTIQRLLGAPLFGGGGYGTVSQAPPSWYFAHQPVVADGRLLVGVCKVIGWGGYGFAMPSTWFVLDYTDVIKSGTTTAGPGTLVPGCVAKSKLGGSMQFICPSSAMVDSDTGATYRFWSIDWKSFAADANPGGNETVYGYNGSMGCNLIAPLSPQYTYGNESTLLAGSVTQSISRGIVREHGFVEDRPNLLWVSSNTGGFLGSSTVASSYTIAAVWRWIDDAGRWHRSAPSTLQTVPFASGVALGKITITVAGPQITAKKGVQVEIYSTDNNPVGQASHFLQGIVDPGTPFVMKTVDHVSDILYIDGGVLENQCPSSSGGIVAVANRIWVAEGTTVTATKLPKASDAPQWNFDDPLSVDLPAAAGRILGLGVIDDKLLILCTRGIWAINGTGPDDLGQGPSFSDPVKISDLGLYGSPSQSGQRLIACSPEGVVFVGQNSLGRELTGGVYAINRSLAVELISQPISSQLAVVSTYTDLMFWSDRQMLALACDLGIFVFDSRTKQWSNWNWTGGSMPLYLCGSNGLLWGVHFASQGAFDPALTPGTDHFIGGNDTYDMEIDLATIPANNDLLGWGRIRGLTLLGDYNIGYNYTLTLTAQMDNTRVSQAIKPVAVAAPAGTWPTPSAGIEWRLPTQKCSKLGIGIVCSPAIPVLTGINIAHRPIGHAPAGQRF